MSISKALVPEFDQEMKTTRRVIERVPAEQFSYKPHEKSMNFGFLAGHIAQLPMWASMTLSTDELDLAGPFSPPDFESTQAMLDMFDKNVAEARQAIANASDEEMMKPWTLRKGDHVIFTLPKAAVIRAMVFSHIIHHRGQLSVYLRLQNIPVPSIYGPSADEGGF